MTTKHTPGPWAANPETGSVHDANGFAIWSSSRDGDPEGWANAALIASAPEQQAKIDALADAMENLIAIVDRDIVEIHAARAALRLAGRIP